MRQVSWVRSGMNVVTDEYFHKALQDLKVVIDILVYPPGILVFCLGTIVGLKLREADHMVDLLQSMDS